MATCCKSRGHSQSPKIFPRSMKMSHPPKPRGQSRTQSSPCITSALHRQPLTQVVRRCPSTGWKIDTLPTPRMRMDTANFDKSKSYNPPGLPLPSSISTSVFPGRYPSGRYQAQGNGQGGLEVQNAHVGTATANYALR